MKNKILSNIDDIILSLSRVYEQFGYSRYKMSKFEEYDLYSDKKDYLISDSIITFTDMGGKLMALKPDVTLSIIKNSKSGETSKVYYKENVYRASGVTHTFKEIMQIGLEYIGNINSYTVCEVLELAAKSLLAVSENSVLDISHLGITGAMADKMELFGEDRAKFMMLIGEKNTHELASLLSSASVEPELITAATSLVSLHGSASEVLPRLRKFQSVFPIDQALSELDGILSALSCEAKKIARIDFSVISDIAYYNGITFKGFIEGVPQSVLSGGQYDRLMKKMKKQNRAIGFAVYTDSLERLIADNAAEYDIDNLVIYSSSAKLEEITSLTQEITARGESVTVLSSVPEGFRAKNVYEISAKGVVLNEKNA